MLKHTTVILIAGIVALPVFAAPKTVLLDDFEGELTGWSAGVEVVAADAGHCLHWTPVGDTTPLSISLNFADRGVEMDEWDRLEFRYKILADSINWWGVKIVDAPLGGGLQATYPIPQDEIVIGEWATARITLHPPTYKWGDTPQRYRADHHLPPWVSDRRRGRDSAR